MNLKQINVVGLILLSFFYVAQSKDTFAKAATQYQLYRLSDDASDDRRPKLAINDQGTVWVAWESDRDGDFDIYGKKFENGDWSDLIEVAQDTNATFICDALLDRKNKFCIFGTEADTQKSAFPEYYFEKSELFFQHFLIDSVAERQVLAEVHHVNPYYNNHPAYPDDLPKAISFDQDIFVCYHRQSQWNNHYRVDSLFLKFYEEEIWHEEFCDSIFLEDSFGASGWQSYGLPLFGIHLINRGLFVIKYISDWHGAGPLIDDMGLIIGISHVPYYITLAHYILDWSGNRIGLQTYSYGSNSKTIFIAGFFYREKYSLEPTHLIKQIELINDTTASDKREWLFDFKDNIKISQTSDLVAFVWSDSANIYLKAFQDSTWYETLAIPLNGLTHIDHSLNCAVYNNQQIWITFDAIYNGNKDVYALSVPASFVVDTMMTEVNSSAENNASPNDFALFQNYPNPFNSSTVIKYSLAENSPVSLKIYDINGRLVDEIILKNQERGEHEFCWTPQSLTSGVYLIKIQTSNWQKTIKAILLK